MTSILGINIGSADTGTIIMWAIIILVLGFIVISEIVKRIKAHRIQKEMLAAQKIKRMAPPTPPPPQQPGVKQTTFNQSVRRVYDSSEELPSFDLENPLGRNTNDFLQVVQKKTTEMTREMDKKVVDLYDELDKVRASKDEIKRYSNALKDQFNMLYKQEVLISSSLISLGYDPSHTPPVQNTLQNEKIVMKIK
jgi:hypothetical protein